MKRPFLSFAPSILNADFRDLAGALREVERGGGDWVHVDVMDAHMVRNLSMGPHIVKCLRCATRLPLDVHLMMDNPELLARDFIKAGARRLTVHAELGKRIVRLIKRIRQAGVKAGVALRPHTPLSVVKPFLRLADMVLLMSVEPGFGGQTFQPRSLSRIRRLRKMTRDVRPDLDVQVDGGVTVANVRRIAAAGANVIVSGCAIFGSDRPARTLLRMRKMAEEGWRIGEEARGRV